MNEDKSMTSSDISAIMYILSMFLCVSIAIYTYVSNARNNIRPLAIEQIGLLVGMIIMCVGVIVCICSHFGLW